MESGHQFGSDRLEQSRSASVQVRFAVTNGAVVPFAFVVHERTAQNVVYIACRAAAIPQCTARCQHCLHRVLLCASALAFFRTDFGTLCGEKHLNNFAENLFHNDLNLIG